MDRRSFIVGSIAVASARLLPPGRALAAPKPSVAVTAAGEVDRVDFEVTVVNVDQPLGDDLTIELALDPDVNLDPRYYSLLDADAKPAPTLAFRPEGDGLASSSRPRLTWRDAVPLAANEVRLYRASIAIANVHPHRFGMVATIATGSPGLVFASSMPETHDRSLGALFATAARRLTAGHQASSWGRYHFLPLRGVQVGFSAAPGWPAVVVAAEVGELVRLGALELAPLPLAEPDAVPRVGTFYRLATDRGPLLAMFADPARLAVSPVVPDPTRRVVAPDVSDLAAELVAARPDLLYHEPPQVVGLMLPGTRGGRVGLSRDQRLSGFAATVFLNATALVAGGVLAPSLGSDRPGDRAQLERAEGGWWLTLAAALDESVG